VFSALSKCISEGHSLNGFLVNQRKSSLIPLTKFPSWGCCGLGGGIYQHSPGQIGVSAASSVPAAQLAGAFMLSDPKDVRSCRSILQGGSPAPPEMPLHSFGFVLDLCFG
jgi:hypothetical protein